MNKKSWIGIGIIFLGALFVIVKLVILPNDNKDKTNQNNSIDINDNSNVNSEENEINWDEITEDGVNEELLLNNLDKDILEKVAKNFQDALDEELKEEKNNPEIVITEGWTRIFDKVQYKEVINIGKPAMKPLYYILYKSSNNGQYEYLCATALQEISGINFKNEDDGTMGWSTAKEYLELFTKEIIKQK